MRSAAGTRSVVAALIGNLLVAATKAVAAFMIGSSAMLSETVHSIVDTGNELLMLYGIRRSRQHPDAETANQRTFCSGAAQASGT